MLLLDLSGCRQIEAAGKIIFNSLWDNVNFLAVCLIVCEHLVNIVPLRGTAIMQHDASQDQEQFILLNSNLKYKK